MVSPEFTIFQNYRHKAAALRNAARDAMEIFLVIGKEFNATNKYLLQRAGISQSLQDRLVKGDKQIKPLLQALIEELNKEIKELDSMLSNISVFGGDAFHNFQRSAISHQKKQADILNELYNLGINYFHNLEEQIHARYLSVEQSHNRFREKLFEILRAIVEGNSYKSAIVDTWMDCLEFLILYQNDDLEVGLPRHTFIELVEQETYSPAKVVLQRYFTAGLGKQFIKKLEEEGLVRRARDEQSQKVTYLSLSEDKQKKVDKIILESLLTLLKDIEFEDSTSQRYVWDKETEDNSRGIKQRIEDKFEEKHKSPITEEITTIIEQLLIEFRTKVIELKAKKFFKYEENNKNLGYNKFIIFVTDNGEAIYVENLRDKKWREKNLTSVLAARDFLKRVLDSGTREPQRDPYVEYLLELEQNKQLLSSSEGSDSGGRSRENEKIPNREKTDISNLIGQIFSYAQNDEAGYGYFLRIPNDAREEVSTLVSQLLIQLFVSKSSFNKDEGYKNERFILVFNAFNDDLEITDDVKEYLKFVFENYESIQNLTETDFNKFYFELLEILNISH
ncbi:MAG: hypothetical protein ACMXYB_02790 [Candidatus Woesearchaeota archaeon]